MQVAAWSSSFGHRLIVWLRWLCVGWLFLAGSAFAQGLTDPAVQRGVAWLQGQIQASGQLASEAASPALPMQVRSEAAITLRALAQTVPPALYTAIEGVIPNTTEYLARKAIGKQLAAGSDAAHLDALIKLQNADGGFGAAAGLASNAQDTAWALLALAANRADTPVAKQALDWLKSSQQPNNAWLLMPDGDAVVTTSLVIQALNTYRQQPGGQVTRNRARIWLLAQRNASKTWVDDLRTAHALLAAIPGSTNAAETQQAIAALRNSQRTDGSWGGDPYITALALRALFLASQPITDPGTQTSTLEVLVIDRSTNKPLANAFVYLDIINTNGYYDTVFEAMTDASGLARISGIEPGRLFLNVIPPRGSDYNDSSEYAIEFQAGKNYSITIPLTPYPDHSGKIYGQVVDADTLKPISGALVRAEGSDGFQHYTNTDANGSYELLNISVNPLWKHWNLSATAAGYMGSSNGYDFSSSSKVDIHLRRIGSMPPNAGTLRTIAVRHPNSDGNYPMGHLFILGPQGTVGSVTSNDGIVSIAFQINASGIAEIRVPWTQYLNQNDQALEKAMLVYASNPVDAYFLNIDGYGSSDMTYLLDVGAIGTRYRIMNWNRGRLGYYGFHMSFTAIEDGTKVTVTPSANITNHSSGVPFSVQINKGQSYIYESSNGNDMTGTLLESDKPISVFSGARCTDIPSDAPYCDHLFTQLPPIDQWANEYVIPRTANTGSAGNLVRILSNNDGNKISINGVNVTNLRAGEFYEYDPAGDFSIKSTHPVLVGQFMKGGAATTWGVLGDPAFTYIPGVKQAKQSYKYIAPAYGVVFRENYVNVAIANSGLSSLRLNGTQVDTRAFRAIPGTDYSAGNVLVPTGSGEIRASIPFVATLSGFDRDISYHTFMGASYSNGTPSGVNPVMVRLGVSTDKPAYPAKTDAWLAGAVVNYGTTAARLKVALRLMDTQGRVVAQFAAKDLGSVSAGATISHTEVWNTGTNAAGTYTVIGTVLDEQDQVLDTASTLLTITAGSGATAPKAALIVSTDKALYQPDDRVLISSLLRNLTTNATLDDVRVVLKVFDPAAQLVFTHEHAVGEIAAEALRTLEVPQLLTSAPPGTYTVEASLIGSGEGLKRLGTKAYDVDVELARASSQYKVIDAAGPGVQPVPGLGTPALALVGMLIVLATGLTRCRIWPPSTKTLINGGSR